MAFRIVHQISCNITKNALLRNSSSHSFLRLRSLSPPHLNVSDAQWPKNEYHQIEQQRRSHSCPSSTNLFNGNVGFQVEFKRIRSSREDNSYQEREFDEYFEEENLEFVQDKELQRNKEKATTQINRAGRLRRPVAQMKLQPKLQTPYLEKDVEHGYSVKKKVEYKEKKREVEEVAKPTVGALNQSAEEKLKRYYLEDSRPRSRSESKYNIYDYLSEQSQLKEATVLPHLQPYNLKPFGTGENLVFPVFNVQRNQTINYPILDPEGRNQPSSTYEQKIEAEMARKNATLVGQQREYSTATKKTNQVENCEDLTSKYKKTSTEHTLPMKEPKLAISKDDENTFIQKTLKFITEFKGQPGIKNSGIANEFSDIEKCNKLIAEYKKLNPDYASTPSRSSSVKQQEANALNFVKTYQKYYSSDIKQEAAELPVPSTDAVPDSNAPNPPTLERKKYSFESPSVTLPEVPAAPIRVKVGPKCNLLQSNAMPDSGEILDDIRVDKNEKLLSPWPSYAEKVKEIYGNRKTRQIKYPPVPQADPKPITKASVNQEIKVASQPKLETCTRSLHKITKSTYRHASSAVIDVNQNKTKRNPTEKVRGNDGSYRKLPNLLPYLNNRPLRVYKRHYSTSQKGTSKSTKFYDSDVEDCPCVEPKIPVDVEPLKRLTKRCDPEEPPKVCPPKVVECPSRADDGLQIKSKKLRPIKPADDCPCKEEVMAEGCPLPRPKIRCEPEPPERVCPCTDPICECPPRADACLKIKRKSLPCLRASACPCVEPEIPEYAPPMKRLAKVDIPAPRCEIKVEKCPPRADDSMVVSHRKLPKLKPSNCPCVEPIPPEDAPLSRLKKVKVEEPPRVCVKKVKCDEIPRADAGLKVEARSLPAMQTPDCPCIEPEPPLDVKPLERPKMLYKPKEPPKICSPPEKCPPRADEGLKLKPKKLRNVVPAECPCIEEEMLEGCPLQRLTKRCEPEPPERVCPCTEPICECPPRADACLKIKRKQLPKLKTPDCPCVEPEPPLDVALTPLKKVKVPEPPKCSPPKPLCQARADEALKFQKKPLPKLKPSDCPCIEKEPPEDIPLSRLKKYKPKDPPRICPVEVCDETQRADVAAGYKVGTKTLPPLLYSDNYKKLKKRKMSTMATLNVSYKRRFSTCSSMRSNWRNTPETAMLRWYSCKSRTYISPNPQCPCVGRSIPSVSPKLKRLPKFKKEDIDWSKYLKCEPKECITPRADDNLVITYKKLPRLIPSKCTCFDYIKPPEFEPKLRRLPKFRKADIKWSKEPPSIEYCPPRADEMLKSKQKSLAVFPKSKCPCVNPFDYMQDSEPLSRLPKFKKDDINWKKLQKCEPKWCPPRADEGLKEREKYLPKLKPSACHCVESKQPCLGPKLKRLGKYKTEDRNWKKLCPKPSCVERADIVLGYRVKKKPLPAILTSRKNKKDYHMLRCPTYVIVPHCRIHSSPLRFKKKCDRPKNAVCNQPKLKKTKDTKKKECKKMESKKEKGCVVLKQQKGCPPRKQFVCEDPHEEKECVKQKSPYPSFSECGTAGDLPTCECPVPDAKFLQPKYPILSEIVVQPPPPPEYELIDVEKEKACVMEKLGMKTEGESRTCDNFDEVKEEFKGMKILAKAEAEAEERAKEQGTTLKKQRKEALEKACCQNKSKMGINKECPVVDTDVCCNPDPKLTAPKGKDKAKRPSLKCDAKTSKSKSVKAKPKSSKSKQSKCKPSTKAAAASKSKTKLKPKEKSSTCSTNAPKTDKRSLLQKILDYFRARPNCPKPDEWKKKKLREDAERAAAAAGLKVCDPCKPCKPKSSKKKDKEKCDKGKQTSGSKSGQDMWKSCQKLPFSCDKKSGKGAKSKKKDKCKPPTMKGASKVKKGSSKKAASGKKVSKKAKCGKEASKKPKCDKKTSKETTCSKKASKETTCSKKASKETKCDKKTLKEPQCSKKTSKETTCSKKASKETKCDKKTSKESKCSKEASKETICSKKAPKETKCDKDTSKSGKSEKGKCETECPKKSKSQGDACAKKETKSKIESKSKECKDKSDEKSEYEQLFPPNMPADCAALEEKLKKAKESDCSGDSGSKSKEDDPCSNLQDKKEKPKPPSCAPKKEKSKSKSKTKTSDCASTKSSGKKAEKESAGGGKCAGGKSGKSSKKDGGPCPKIGTDCPPRVRETCEDERPDIDCKAQIAPYPSFSECRPPFPKRKVCECKVAKDRAKDTMLKINYGGTKKTKCSKKDEKDGTSSGRKYSTVSYVCRPLRIHTRRHYSSNSRTAKLLTTKSKKRREQQLSEKLLTGIEATIKRIESKNNDLDTNPYYHILKMLQQLSENELHDFFDQELQFDSVGPLKQTAPDTISYVCKLNPRTNPQQTPLQNDNAFESKCIRISDLNARFEEAKLVEAFRDLCRKLYETPEQLDLPFEEIERMKTEEVKRQFDEFLKGNYKERV